MSKSHIFGLIKWIVILCVVGAGGGYGYLYFAGKKQPPYKLVTAPATRGDLIQVVTATSGELLRCLFEILSPEGRELLARSAVLVGGPRIGAVARQIGIHGPLVVAAAPDDDNLLDALLKWRGHTSDP